MELQIDSLHFLLHTTLLSAATRRYGNRKVHQEFVSHLKLQYGFQ